MGALADGAHDGATPPPSGGDVGVPPLAPAPVLAVAKAAAAAAVAAANAAAAGAVPAVEGSPAICRCSVAHGDASEKRPPLPNMEGDGSPRGDCRGDGPETERTEGERPLGMPTTALWHEPVRGAVPGAAPGAVPGAAPPKPSGAHRLYGRTARGSTTAVMLAGRASGVDALATAPRLLSSKNMTRSSRAPTTAPAAPSAALAPTTAPTPLPAVGVS